MYRLIYNVGRKIGERIELRTKPTFIGLTSRANWQRRDEINQSTNQLYYIPLPHFHQKRDENMRRTFVFVIIFFVGYGFGLFSGHRPPANTGSTDTYSFNCEKNNEDRHELKKPTVVPRDDLLRFRTECAKPIPESEVLQTLLKKLYNEASPYHSFPQPHLRPFLKPRRAHGWGSTGSVFKTLIQSTKPRIIIEVGTFLGASAIHMANLTTDLGTLILCLDDFRGWPGFNGKEKGLFAHLVDVNGDVILMQRFMKNVMDAGVERRVLPVPFSTAAGLAALCDWGIYGDLVEVDAGHDFHSAWVDVNMAWAVVRPGGTMFGHDYNLAADDHGVRRAVDLFAKVKGLKVRPDGQHWVLLPSKPLDDF